LKRFAILFTLALSLAAALLAESPAPAPPAPLPSAIAHAKTVFISNNAARSFFESGHNLIYDEFYADLATAKRYQIVDDPAQADLVLEIEYPGYLYGDLRLLVIDTKSHFTLWSLATSIDAANLRSTRDKNLRKATEELANKFLMLGK
jgi:hypothetical protein